MFIKAVVHLVFSSKPLLDNSLCCQTNYHPIWLEILYDRFGGLSPQLQFVIIEFKRNSPRHLGRYESDVAARGADPS
ncbi:6625_t:CDS:1, partial [Ambispora gerdemannii]